MARVTRRALLGGATLGIAYSSLQRAPAASKPPPGPPALGTLGAPSWRLLEGLQVDLVRVVGLATELTMVDFIVLEGLRSHDSQRRLYDAGRSETLNSRHLTGHAVDLVPLKDRVPTWDWAWYYPLARAMKISSEELAVPIRWGGCWELLSEIDDPEQAVAAYVAARRALGQDAFIDGPHFEVPA